MRMMMGTKARRNMKGKTLLRKEKWNGEKSMDGRFGVKTCMFVLFFTSHNSNYPLLALENVKIGKSLSIFHSTFLFERPCFGSCYNLCKDR